MIITLKDKNSVWMGVSSENATPYIHPEDAINEENFNMWRVNGTPNCIMASLFYGGIDLDRLKYYPKTLVKGALNQKNLITKTIPMLKDIFGGCDMLDDNESWHPLVVAKGDTAFTILPTFTCCEIEDFDVCGSTNGEQIAYGAMTIYKSLPPVERIIESFRAVNSLEKENFFPIVLMNTKTKDRIVIYE